MRWKFGELRHEQNRYKEVEESSSLEREEIHFIFRTGKISNLEVNWDTKGKQWELE